MVTQVWIYSDWLLKRQSIECTEITAYLQLNEDWPRLVAIRLDVRFQKNLFEFSVFVQIPGTISMWFCVEFVICLSCLLTWFS